MNSSRRWNIKLVLDQHFFINIYCLFLLLMPEELIRITSIYEISSPREIVYRYRSFNFSFFWIPAIVLAGVLFVKERHKEEKLFFWVIFINAIVDSIGSILGRNRILAENRIELYLVMLEAFAICVLFFYQKSLGDTIRLFIIYYYLCFSTQLLRLALGLSDHGRFGAIGLGVGATGYLFSLTTLYTLFCSEMDQKAEIIIISGLAGLVLTGQRTNIFITLLFIALFGLYRSFFQRNSSNNEKRRSRFYWGLLGIGLFALLIIVALTSLGIRMPGAEFINRVFDAINNYLRGDLSQEASYVGRTRSIDAGIRVLKNNPLGIANDFYTLQKMTADAGYAIFPHSTLLCILLLWKTPVVFVMLIYIIRLLLKLHSMRSPYLWIVLYIVILSVIWGSPFMGSPILFINLFFITLCSKLVNESSSNRMVAFVWRKHR